MARIKSTPKAEKKAFSPPERPSRVRPASLALSSRAAENPSHITHTTDLPPNCPPKEPKSHEVTTAPSKSPSPKKAKPVWDAFSRYFSDDSSSFPDYGAPKINMKLKRLNASGVKPVNTMSGQPSPASRSATHIPIQTNPRSKPRRDSSSSSIVVEITAEDASRSTKSGNADRGTRPARPNTYQSRGAVTQTYSALTFRSSKPPFTQLAKHLGQQENHLRAESIEDDSIPPAHRRRRSPSPKAIAIDDLAKDSPPPARVKSDLIGTKRPRPGLLLSQRQGKRAKRSERESFDEPDELQVIQKGERKTHSRYFERVSDPESSCLRTDLKSSYFSTPHTKEDVAHQSRFGVKQAVSGSHYYVAEKDQRGSVFLQSAPESPWLFSAVDSNNRRQEDLAWMDIDFRKILKLFSSNCSFVEVSRPHLAKCPSKVVFQFSSSNEATELAHNKHIDDGTAGRKKDIELKAVFKTALRDAQNRHASIRKQDRSGFAPQARGRRSASPHDVPAAEPNRHKEGAMSAGQDEQTDFNFSQRHTRRSSDQNLLDFEGLPTRRTRRSAPALLNDDVVRWTHINPDWAKNWHQSLIWPPTGKNRSTVDKDDIPRLDEGEFLNDNLINFWIRHLQHKLESDNPKMLKRVYFFSTFFFEKLKYNQGKIDYQGVKSWTSKVDIFSYDYLVVPVNENAHWYLAIVCNPGKLLPQELRRERDPEVLSDAPEKVAVIGEKLSEVRLTDDSPQSSGPSTSQKPTTETTPRPDVERRPEPRLMEKPVGSKVKAQHDPDRPRIITLDSLGSSHSKTCSVLKLYLAAEAKDKKDADDFTPPVGLTAKSIPQQDNWCDCGIYVLAYVEQFLNNPDESVRKILQKERTDWKVVAPEQRKSIRQLILKLQQHQQEDAEKEKAERQSQKKARIKSKQAIENVEVALKPKELVELELGEIQNTSMTAQAIAQAHTKSFSTLTTPTHMTSPAQPRRTAQSPTIVHNLPRGSSERDCSKNPSSAESFHTARSSPALVDSAESNIPTPRSKTKDHPGTGNVSPQPNEEEDVVLIDKLQSSPTVGKSSIKSATGEARKRKRPLGSEDSTGMSTRRRKFADQITDVKRGPLESIEVEDDDEVQHDSGVKYDGIDRNGRADQSSCPSTNSQSL